jgi:hypothetical protein
MQTATIVDQSVVNDAETLDITYADNFGSNDEIDPVRHRLEMLIARAATTAELLDIKKALPEEFQHDEELLDQLETKKQQLLTKK